MNKGYKIGWSNVKMVARSRGVKKRKVKKYSPILNEIPDENDESDLGRNTSEVEENDITSLAECFETCVISFLFLK